MPCCASRSLLSLHSLRLAAPTIAVIQQLHKCICTICSMLLQLQLPASCQHTMDGDTMSWQLHCGLYLDTVSDFSSDVFVYVAVPIMDDLCSSACRHSRWGHSSTYAHRQMQSVILSECLQGRNVLRKEPMSKEIEDEDQFIFNEAFQSKFYKVKIGTISAQKESEPEKQETRLKVGPTYAVQSSCARVC